MEKTQEEIVRIATSVAGRIDTDQVPEFVKAWKESGKCLEVYCSKCHEEIKAWGEMYAGTVLSDKEVEDVLLAINSLI